MLGNIHYDAWMTLFLKRRKVLDYELFEQQAINNNKTYEFITSMQEIKLQDCESKSFSFPQKNNAFALFLQKYLVSPCNNPPFCVFM